MSRGSVWPWPFVGLWVVLCARAAFGQTAWPGAWETATPVSVGLDADGLEKAWAWLAPHNGKPGLVIRHGRIVAEWYFAGADRHSRFAAYSTSKSLSGLALLSPVFRAAAGREIDEFLQERVFQQMSIRSEDWNWEHREGYAVPYSGWHTTAQSLGRVGLLVLHQGKWDNNILVVPSLDLVVIRQSDLAPAQGHQIAEYFQMACEAVKER